MQWALLCTRRQRNETCKLSREDLSFPSRSESSTQRQQARSSWFVHLYLVFTPDPIKPVYELVRWALFFNSCLGSPTQSGARSLSFYHKGISLKLSQDIYIPISLWKINWHICPAGWRAFHLEFLYNSHSQGVSGVCVWGKWHNWHLKSCNLHFSDSKTKTMIFTSNANNQWPFGRLFKWELEQFVLTKDALHCFPCLSNRCERT